MSMGDRSQRPRDERAMPRGSLAESRLASEESQPRTRAVRGFGQSAQAGPLSDGASSVWTCGGHTA